MPTSDSFQALCQANEAMLPPLYARWVSGLLRHRIPAESLATCHDCAMCSGAKTAPAPAPAVKYFDPSAKCCTYFPALPNFLVGGALLNAATDPVGRQSLVDRIKRQVGVSPVGMEMPAEYSLRYGVMAADAFGRVPSMRCPHYLDREGGLCGIWRNRNAVCSTWFCKFARGSVGRDFWESLRNLLSAAENSLALWAAGQVGIPLETLREALAEPREGQPQLNQQDLSGTVDAHFHARQWGDWLGREADYYQACAQAVQPLAWEDIERLGGASLQAHARIVREDFAKLLRRRLPPALELNKFEILSTGPGGFCVSGYSPADPVEMSPLLMKMLCYFDGHPTKEILTRIAENERVELDRNLLLRLIDYGLIKPSEPRRPALESVSRGFRNS